jgi:hypothetical protein
MKPYRILYVLIIGFLLACQSDYTIENKALFEFIPPQTGLIIKADNFKDLQKNIQATEFYKANKDNFLISKCEKKLALLQNIPIQQAGYLCLTPIGKSETAISFVTKNNTDNQIPVSNEDVVKRFTYNGKEINEIELKNDVFYFTRFKEVVVFSSSQLIIENCIRNQSSDLQANIGLKKANQSVSSDQAVFVNLKYKNQLFDKWLPLSLINNFKAINTWVSLDLNFRDDGLLFNGVFFDEQKTDLSYVADGNRYGLNLAPNNTMTFLSMNYPDLDSKNENQRQFPKYFDLIKLTDEFFKIRTKNQTVFGLHCVDTKKTVEYLKSISSENLIFRDKQIYKLDKKDILVDFENIKTSDVSYYTQIKDFILLSPNVAALKNLIISYQNNALFNTTSYADLIDKNFTDKQDFFGFVNLEQITQVHTDLLKTSFFKNLKNMKFNNAPVVSLQINKDDNIDYLSLYIPKTSLTRNKNTPSQVNRITIEQTIAKRPEFFVNWRTQQRDLVFQDINNKLYLYDTKGNLIWDKQLDSRIVGNIHTIDIYKNTRKQLCFTTQNKLYLIDKNGNNVSPFPKNEKRLITQGLSIYDYVNNGKYRFVIVQDDRIRMYDRQLNKVNGFRYKRNGRIKSSPKHLRFNNKDYIVVESSENQIQILNRRGKKRISIKGNPQFSHNGIYGYNDKFITTSLNGSLIKIDQNGGLSFTDLDLSKNHMFSAAKKHWVVIDNNRLIINNNERELDYGLYTKPQIHKLNERVLISFTDTQAGKIYLFNDQAELLPGFPIYGKTAIDLYENAQNELVFTCLGEDNAVLVYKL